MRCGYCGQAAEPALEKSRDDMVLAKCTGNSLLWDAKKQRSQNLQSSDKSPGQREQRPGDYLDFPHMSFYLFNRTRFTKNGGRSKKRLSKNFRLHLIFMLTKM